MSAVLVPRTSPRHACWAQARGHCAPFAPAHIPLRHAFGTHMVAAEGLPSSPARPRLFGIASLCGRVLCARHHALLSPLDGAALHAFRALAHFDRTLDRGRARTLEPLSYEVDATLLQRWLLKVTIDLLSLEPVLVADDGRRAGQPSAQMLAVVFGDEPFPGAMGLEVARQIDMGRRFDPTLRFRPVLDEAGRRARGAVFEYRGLAMLLHLDRAAPVEVDAGSWRGGLSGRAFRDVRYIDRNGIDLPAVSFAWPEAAPLAR